MIVDELLERAREINAARMASRAWHAQLVTVERTAAGPVPLRNSRTQQAEKGCAVSAATPYPLPGLAELVTSEGFRCARADNVGLRHFVGKVMAPRNIAESWVIGRVGEIDRPVRAYPWYTAVEPSTALRPRASGAGNDCVCAPRGILVYRPNYVFPG